MKSIYVFTYIFFFFLLQHALIFRSLVRFVRCVPQMQTKKSKYTLCVPLHFAHVLYIPAVLYVYYFPRLCTLCIIIFLLWLLFLVLGQIEEVGERASTQHFCLQCAYTVHTHTKCVRFANVSVLYTQYTQHIPNMLYIFRKTACLKAFCYDLYAYIIRK